jgi:uroporphyrinogen decarboxylase
MKTPLIVKVWKNENVERMPIWLMRQAGRYLPEYRTLRAQAGSFLTMCYTPKLAAEVTLQPMRRFDLDAAIIFSDILVVPDALGQRVYFVEGEGPKLDPIDFKNLKANDKLKPVYEAIGLVRSDLAKDKALIGFAGGPFTLASYMIEGGGGHDFARTKAFMREKEAEFTALIDLLADTVAQHLLAQIAAGVNAVQIFESHAGQLTGAEFAQFVVRPVRKIVAAINGAVPVIGFARGAAHEDLLRFCVDTGLTVAGIDQHTDIAWAARNIPPRVVLQGNLDPDILRSGDGLDGAVARIREATAGRPHVFNLGHGVIKDTNPDHVARLVEAVHGVKVGA